MDFLLTQIGEFPKNLGPDMDTKIGLWLLQEHPQQGPPTYRRSQVLQGEFLFHQVEGL